MVQEAAGAWKISSLVLPGAINLLGSTWYILVDLSGLIETYRNLGALVALFIGPWICWICHNWGNGLPSGNLT